MQISTASRSQCMACGVPSGKRSNERKEQRQRGGQEDGRSAIWQRSNIK